MTREEALDLIERMPFITTIKAPHRKARLELYKISAEADDPVEWIKVIKSCYVGMNFGGIRLGEEEMALAQDAKRRLEAELSAALGIAGHEVEPYINSHIDNSF